MKQLIISSLLFSITNLFAQSILERNLEPSDYYFNRQLLNPYGLRNFKDISPGFIDNVFLNIIINPAKITETTEKYSFYIDFRGVKEQLRKYIPMLSL
ncbi:MAG: hypothetical protein ACPL25_03545 [Ignavibacteria bacterium]